MSVARAKLGPQLVTLVSGGTLVAQDRISISITWRTHREDGFREDPNERPVAPANARRKDQSCNTPDVEFPYLQRVYRLLGAEGNVENLHLADGNHDYGYPKRVGAYRFFAKHLNLDLKALYGNSQEVDESFVRILPESELHVWTTKHPRPSHALQGDTAVEAAFRAS